MQLSFVLPLVCIILNGNIIAAYRTDITEDGEMAFCEHRKHLTFKPTATCCANKVIKPGLDITKFWQQCFQQNAGKSETIEGFGWGMYSCILKASSGKDQLSLQEFADLITSQYPDDIKSKINAEVQTQSVPAASITNYDRLEKIRVTYYDIEKEVCEGMPSETKSYGKIEMCSSYKEENHRAGMCCSKSYPVDIRYQSLFEAASVESMDSCREIIHNATVIPEPEIKKSNATENDKLNATETVMVNATDVEAFNETSVVETTLLDICDVVCTMQAQFQFDIKSHIIDNTNYWNFNVTENLQRFPYILPYFIHPSVRPEVLDYLISTFSYNNTVEAMKNYQFPGVVGGDSSTKRSSHNIAYVHVGNKTAYGEDFKYDFMGRRFHRGILHIPIFCSAYHELAALAEYKFFRTCKPEDVTEAPAPVEEPKAAEPEPTATDAPA